MKMPKVLRPEIDIEYKGVLGFLCAMFCICRVRIKRMSVDFTMCNQIVCNQKFWIIPKYKFTKKRFDENNPKDGGNESDARERKR